MTRTHNPNSRRGGLPIFTGSGVYLVTNTKTGKNYVGSAASIRGRLLYHRSFLRRNKHDNEHLQRSWNKWGEKAFRFDVLEVCELAVLIAKEQYWIDRLRACDGMYGYNICPAAGSAMTGRNHSEASRKKMSEQRKGMDTSKATKAAAEVNRGKNRSREVCARIAEAHRGKKKTAEHLENLKRNHWCHRPDAKEISLRAARTYRERRRGILHGSTTIYGTTSDVNT